MCRDAKRVDLQFDSDGIKDNRQKALSKQLQTNDGIKLKLSFLCQTSNDLGIIPQLSIFDLYNKLRGFSDFDNESMRKFENIEGHHMFRDGHVNHIEFGLFDNTKEYCFVVSHVKPRTNEKDPISKLLYYKLWIIFNKNGLENSVFFQHIMVAKVGAMVHVDIL